MQVLGSIESFRNGYMHASSGRRGYYRVSRVHPDFIGVLLGDDSDAIPRKGFHYTTNC